MFVMRVECKHGGGIFHGCREMSDEEYCRSVSIPTGYQSHPTPQYEGYDMRSHERSAVATFRDLVHWFKTKGLRQELHREGWILAFYEIPDAFVKVLSNQVCYNSYMATRIGEMPLVKVHEMAMA